MNNVTGGDRPAAGGHNNQPHRQAIQKNMNPSYFSTYPE